MKAFKIKCYVGKEEIVFGNSLKEASNGMLLDYGQEIKVVPKDKKIILSQSRPISNISFIEAIRLYLQDKDPVVGMEIPHKFYKYTKFVVTKVTNIYIEVDYI